MRVARGVTLTELLGCVAGMVCLIAILTSALAGAKDAAYRAACAANLAQIGTALRLYAQDWDGCLPDSGAASALGGPVPSDGCHFPSRFNAPGTCTWPKVRAVGNQANLWILVREGYAAPGLFVCPAASDRRSLNAETSGAVMGFLATDPATGKPTAVESRFLKRVTAGHCSYSYQNQFVHPATSPEIADPRNATTRIGVHPQDLAILADRNPYTRTDLVNQPIVSPTDQPEANSLNHRGLGQNVLYLGGEVQWQETPCCGPCGGPLRPEGLRDNIYWPEAGLPDDPENVPRSIYDSYLVP
jgi:hypothetical protein